MRFSNHSFLGGVSFSYFANLRDDFPNFLFFVLGNSFIFMLFTWADCTDEILISYVNSAKNSLIVITHSYFLIYVSKNILH